MSSGPVRCVCAHPVLRESLRLLRLRHVDDRAHLIDDYVDALLLEAARYDDVPPATSVFFGGGTPSLAAGRCSWCSTRSSAPPAPKSPSSATRTRRRARSCRTRAGGVNRISFGVQSMPAARLARSGARTFPRTWRAAVKPRRGIERVNVDLIYGTPGETVDDWAATLDAALALGPRARRAPTRSTVEPGTPLGTAVAAGTAAPDDDDQAAKYELVDERLEAAGLRLVRDLELGPARRGVPAQPPLLDRRRLPRRSVALRTAPKAAAAGPCARPSATSTRVARRAFPEAGDEQLDTARRTRRSKLGLALRTRHGVAADGLRSRRRRRARSRRRSSRATAGRVVLTRSRPPPRQRGHPPPDGVAPATACPDAAHESPRGAVLQLSRHRQPQPHERRTPDGRWPAR